MKTASAINDDDSCEILVPNDQEVSMVSKDEEHDKQSRK